MQPKREILSMQDMLKWKRSKAYAEYIQFINNLSDSVMGCSLTDDIKITENIQKILDMIKILSNWIDEIPPIQQPQRFGNQSFRTWFTKVKENSKDLLKEFINDEAQVDEISYYLIDSFGNQTRIDYGTGHEMCFAMFLMCLFKIDFLKKEESKAVVLRIFNEYLNLARKLQITYNMEPAGSHGVWSLDDFQFLPFIFGSSQLIESRIDPQKFVEISYIDRYKDENMFFSCLKFITSVKNGPFAEHSNQLWNISMVPSWTKINSGLKKMYSAEVLDKFPVVQHILFGTFIDISQKN